MQNPENKDSELLVRLSCYEPAGHEVAWTEPEFLQHVLMMGMTGSGKTSQIRRIIHQLIHHQASDPEKRVGLCLLDGKVDDTVAHVQEMARQAHRLEDIATIGPGGDYALDLFGSLLTLADVDRTTRRLAFGSHSMGQDNAFWDEFRYALLDAALTLLVINQVPVEFASALEFLHRLFFVAQAGDERLKQVEARARDYLRWAPAAARRKVRQALEMLTTWRTMEGRTKSTVQATLMNVIRPLVSLSASPCFEPHGRGYFAIDSIVQEGRIGVVSVNTLAEPGLASLLFKLAKEEFFRAVQARGAQSHRLCGLVADEWPLIVTPEDAEQLATIRSRRCFLLAASQGLSGLDERVGSRVRRSLLSNFGSLVLFRSREWEVDALAAQSFGTRPEPLRIPRQIPDGDLMMVDFLWNFPVEQVPVCPPGALGRLASHQAFVSLPESGPQPAPVWFVPAHEDPALPVAGKLAGIPSLSADERQDAAHLFRLMQQRGIQLCLSREMLQALLEMDGTLGERDRHLKEVRACFRSHMPVGLDSLPLSWLKAIPGLVRSLSRRWPGLDSQALKRLAQSEGVLLVDFADRSQHLDPKILDQVRITLNRSLFPSYWRPLHPGQRVRLLAKRPDLSPRFDRGATVMRRPHPA